MFIPVRPHRDARVHLIASGVCVCVLGVCLRACVLCVCVRERDGSQVRGRPISTLQEARTATDPDRRKNISVF